MYELLESIFRKHLASRQFEHDLDEKDYVILLRSPDDARVAGFSTLMKIRGNHPGTGVS